MNTVFSSKRERWLWVALGVVLTGIYATLGSVPAIASFLRDRDVLTETLFFVAFLSLLVIPVLFIRKRPGRAEIGVWAGVLMVYLMAWIRIGVVTPEERTHLFEYGLVAALVHEALIERRENGRRVPVPAVLALVIAALLGWLDEGIQFLLPNRVYDMRDVLFNTLAAVMIIGARVAVSFVLRWVQRRRREG